jgi:hypothetical protein
MRTSIRSEIAWAGIVVASLLIAFAILKYVH